MKQARPTLKYVVFVGGDDQIPFFRVPDLSRIATRKASPTSSARTIPRRACEQRPADDNPYLDTRPIPASGRQLFVPDLIGGRLVEKPTQITGAITRFENSSGFLRSSTAFVSGYDFVTDGSTLVQNRLASILGANSVRTLISASWSKAALLAAASPRPAGHHWSTTGRALQRLPGACGNSNQSDLISTAALTGARVFSGGVFFTISCHAGFQTTDVIVGASAPDKLDWAETFAGMGTAFVGNTGFGLGNTDSAASPRS